MAKTFVLEKIIYLSLPPFVEKIKIVPPVSSCARGKFPNFFQQSRVLSVLDHVFNAYWPRVEWVSFSPLKGGVWSGPPPRLRQICHFLFSRYRYLCTIALASDAIRYYWTQNTTSYSSKRQASKRQATSSRQEKRESKRSCPLKSAFWSTVYFIVLLRIRPKRKFMGLLFPTTTKTSIWAEWTIAMQLWAQQVVMVTLVQPRRQR